MVNENVLDFLKYFSIKISETPKPKRGIVFNKDRYSHKYAANYTYLY